jgi:DNA replication protein
VPGILVPDEVFRDVIPRIRDVAELKVVLEVARIAAETGRPGVWLDELLRPRSLRVVVARESPVPEEDRLREVLARAVANGFLLRVTVGEADGRAIYFLAGEASRKVVERLAGGDSVVAGEVGLADHESAVIVRPTIYAFFEQHVGPLTPIVAEQLRQAERAYPRRWLEDAILTAAEQNHRAWRYIESILLRWEERGAPRTRGE